MMVLQVSDVLKLHHRLVVRSGTLPGLRDAGLLASALAQPRMTFGGTDLYPTLPDKAAALAYSLIRNHAFVDGNKRVGHGALELFLRCNGFEIEASVDEQEDVILQVAAGTLDREALTVWLAGHIVPKAP